MTKLYFVLLFGVAFGASANTIILSGAVTQDLADSGATAMNNPPLNNVLDRAARSGCSAAHVPSDAARRRHAAGGAMAIFRKVDKDFLEAVEWGAANEDDSQGYALFHDPATHADQLKLLAWTRAHPAIVLKVLPESREARQRAYAAQALGYAERSPEQIAALVTAAFDPDDGVRNNAVRALEVLCTVGPEVTR
jgi:hypothetical protein